MAENTFTSDDDWKSLTRTILSSLRNDFFQLTEEDSTSRFRSMLLLNQLESQLKFGQVKGEEEVQHMIMELGAIAEKLNITDTELLVLVKNINWLSNAYSDLPEEKPADIPHIVIIGETGTGKSSLGNVFLGAKKFNTSSAMKSCTAEISSFTGTWLNRVKPVLVMDTPGLNDAEMEDKDNLANLEKQLKVLEYVSAFVLVFNSSQLRITRTHHNMIEILQAMFGLDFFLNACIVFTNWSAHPEIEDRRKKQGITAEAKQKEINRLLQERFNLICEIPCFFIDNLEWENGFNRDAHEKFLEHFFEVAVNLPPFNLINLDALRRNTQEVEQMLERQKDVLRSCPRKKLPSQEAAKVSTALDLIEAPPPTQPEDSGRQLVRYDESFARQQKHRSSLGVLGTVIDVVGTVAQFIPVVQAVVRPVQQLIRNGAMVIKGVCKAAKAVGNFFKRLF